MRKQRLIVMLLLSASTSLAFSMLKDAYRHHRWRKILEELAEQDGAGPQQQP
jgi:hypothetical protein